LEKFLGKVSKGKKSKYKKYADSQKKPLVYIMNKKTDQAQIAIGYKSFSIFDKQRTILSVLATILGGGMSSRLFIEVREKRGLCYFVRTFAEYYLDQGYIGTFSGVTLNKIDEAIKVILREHKKIITEEISVKELNKAKEYIKGKFLLSAEGSHDIAHFIGMEKLILDRVISIENYFKEIDSVTILQIKKIAREIFVPHQLNLAIIGPFKGQEKRFEKLLEL
ncbi:MAG: insulinase family protein, partial [Patescibacteria group bacterium]